MASKDNAKRRIRIVTIIQLILGVGLLGAAGWGFMRVRSHVEGELTQGAVIPAVVLKSRPVWMSEALAGQIVQCATPNRPVSAMDKLLLREINDALLRNAWVKKVRQVRRVFGQSPGDTIEIDCDFRAPIALVAWRNQYYLVDVEGVKLPAYFPVNSGNPRLMFAADGKVNIRIIDGVAAAPPAKDGARWGGEDLQAGIDLVKLLYGRNVAEDIYRVNVANFKGRKVSRDPQITLVTRHNTEIRWGEPIQMAFHAELSPADKINRLVRLQQQFNRVDGGHSWIDIRLDKILYPAEENPVVQAGGQ
jgi:hypothetical protein